MMNSERTIFRKYLRKQAYHLVKETIEWIGIVWLFLGWLFIVVSGLLLWIGEDLGINWGFTAIGFIVVVFGFWIGAWILVFIVWFLDWLKKEIKKNYRIVKEKTKIEISTLEDNLSTLENNICPKCKTVFDNDSIHCSGCGIQLRKRIDNDSYVWHYSG